MMIPVFYTASETSCGQCSNSYIDSLRRNEDEHLFTRCKINGLKCTGKMGKWCSEFELKYGTDPENILKMKIMKDKMKVRLRRFF